MSVWRLSLRLLASLLVFLWLSPIQAAQPMVAFDSPEKAALYQQLINEFRCVKCQNQTIANSPAGIADDLRRKIHDQVAEGKNRDEIAAYLVARYGDFVLYKPPFKPTTYALWLGPFLLLVLALWYAWRISTQPQRSKSVISDKDLATARELLKKSEK